MSRTPLLGKSGGGRKSGEPPGNSAGFQETAPEAGALSKCSKINPDVP
jgi:hypothetical protein